MKKRDVWFVVDALNAEFSQKIHEVLNQYIIMWIYVNSDRNGNVTYRIKILEENLVPVRKWFKSESNKKICGIMKSGVIENGQLIGWPREEKAAEPSTIPEIEPPNIVAKKRSALRTFLNLFRKHALGKTP